jgi:predicted dehydrogenase
VPVTLRGGVGTTAAEDSNRWTLNDAIRLRDWSIAERRAPDGVWAEAPDAMPNERMRPLVLKRQLAGVAAMTRGEAHPLATLREALEVQEVVEAILAAT